MEAQIVHIDFEGRTDGESLRRILKEIKPRQLIIVRGAPESRENLGNYFRTSKELSSQGRVFVPEGLETVDATTESHIYQVKLLDSLVSSLKFARARDTEIAWIDAQITAQPRDGDQDLGTVPISLPPLSSLTRSTFPTFWRIFFFVFRQFRRCR